MAATDKDNLKLTKDIYNAFDKGDLNVMRSCLTNTSTLKLMPMNETLKGPQDILNYFGAYVSAFNAKMDVARTVACDDLVISEFRGKGKQTEVFHTPNGDIPPTNRTIDVPVCHIIQWKDGKIVELHEYFDRATFMNQLGLPMTQEQQAY